MHNLTDYFKTKYFYMIQRKVLLTVCWLMLTCAFMLSCQDIADDDHYAAPSWLKGNAWEVLEGEGNHSSFLRAIELTGYKPIVNGHTILTIAAPNDEAWQTYLQEQGYTSVDDMYQKAPQALKKAVGFHLMYYAYDWDKMVNFRPSEGDGASEEARETDAGLWYKHRTRSQDDMEDMQGKLSGADTTVTVYHYERFLPVLSNKFFATKGIDAKTNYEYFFPKSQWSPSGDGFQIANASVTDANAVVTDNGYLYHVNQVVRPMETIYQTLKQNANYSDFISLYDQYAEFTEAAKETNDKVGKVVYTLTHGVLPNIACEWPVTDYRKMETLERAAYNIFAPSNQAISKFFQNYWTAEGGYQSLDDLDPLIMQYFIMQSFAQSNEPVFPEEIRKGQVETSFGTPINIEPDDVDDRLFCENGVVYGMNDMKAPAIFSSVVGPAFKDTTYQCLLYTLDKSDLILSLASDKSEFVVLVPTNKQYNQNEPEMRLNVTSQGKNLEVFNETDGGYANISQGQARSIINIHTAPNLNALKTTGTQVVETNTAFNYWFVNDGKITTNTRFNEQLSPAYTGDPFVTFHEVTKAGEAWKNGRAYAYDSNDLFTSQTGDGLEHLLVVGNDKNYKYYIFSQLLQKAGIVASGKMSSIFVEGERTIVFVPTNEAIKQNIDKIPCNNKLTIADDYTLSGSLSSTEKAQLASYLRKYFITSQTNTITSYPYPGSNCKGTFHTVYNITKQDADPAVDIDIESDGLFRIGWRVKDAAPTTWVNVSTNYAGLPFAFSDGCMQFIDGVLSE